MWFISLFCNPKRYFSFSSVKISKPHNLCSSNGIFTTENNIRLPTLCHSSMHDMYVCMQLCVPARTHIFIRVCSLSCVRMCCIRSSQGLFGELCSCLVGLPVHNRCTLLSHHFFMSHFLLQHRVCVLLLQNFVCRIFGGVYPLWGRWGDIPWSPPLGSYICLLPWALIYVSSPGLLHMSPPLGSYICLLPRALIYVSSPGLLYVSSPGLLYMSPPLGSYICLLPWALTYVSSPGLLYMYCKTNDCSTVWL